MPEVRVAPPSDNNLNLADLRQLGKQDIFKGESGDFADWAFILKSYLACINPQYVGLLERAEQNRSPMPNRALSLSDQQLSTKLYYILVMLTMLHDIQVTSQGSNNHQCSDANRMRGSCDAH